MYTEILHIIIVLILSQSVKVQKCNTTSAPYTVSNIGGTIGGVVGGLVGGITIGVVTMVIMYKIICAPNKDTCRKRKENKGKTTPATKQ